MQIANPNLIVQTEPLKERVYWNPKTPLKEIFEPHDLTWLWIGVPLANGLLVASRFPPLLCHDSCFLLCVIFRHRSGLADERGNGGGLIGGDFGGIRVDERKKMAAAVNGNGV